MTTYAQLDRMATTMFVPAMKERGFCDYKKFIFAAENDVGIHFILDSYIFSSKERMRITPSIWVPEFDENKENFSFPYDTSLLAKFPSYQYPDWREVFDIEDEVQIQKSFNALLKQLDELVFPWFRTITNGQAVVDNLLPGAVGIPGKRALIPRIIEKYR